MYSEGLIYTEGNLGFKIDWASLWWEGNLPFLLCLQIPSTSSPGIYIRRGDLTEGFLRYDFEGLIFGGAYFRNFTVCRKNPKIVGILVDLPPNIVDEWNG